MSSTSRWFGFRFPAPCPIPKVLPKGIFTAEFFDLVWEPLYLYFFNKMSQKNFSLSCQLKYQFLIFIPNVWLLSAGVRRNMEYSPWERGNSFFFP